MKIYALYPNNFKIETIIFKPGVKEDYFVLLEEGESPLEAQEDFFSTVIDKDDWKYLKEILKIPIEKIENYLDLKIVNKKDKHFLVGTEDGLLTFKKYLCIFLTNKIEKIVKLPQSKDGLIKFEAISEIGKEICSNEISLLKFEIIFKKISDLIKATLEKAVSEAAEKQGKKVVFRA